jgi:protein phosphatase
MPESAANHADVDTVAISPARTGLGVRSFGLTDPGRVRPANEDQYLIATLVKSLRVESTSLPGQGHLHGSGRGHLFMVADGMGGHAAGEEASALAVRSVEAFVLEGLRWFTRLKGPGLDRVLAEFEGALSEASDRIRDAGARDPGLSGMGTTLTLAYSLDDDLFVAHVGDSRCYLYRKGAARRLTRDHTLVEDLVRRGAITAEEAETHPRRHVITNALGGSKSGLEVEVHKVRLEAGDVLLLCSDGLTNMVPDADLSRVLGAEPDPERAARRLVACANEAGGGDNVTVVVARFERGGEAGASGADTAEES